MWISALPMWSMGWLSRLWGIRQYPRGRQWWDETAMNDTKGWREFGQLFKSWEGMISLVSLLPINLVTYAMTWVWSHHKSQLHTSDLNILSVKLALHSSESQSTELQLKISAHRLHQISALSWHQAIVVSELLRAHRQHTCSTWHTQSTHRTHTQSTHTHHTQHTQHTQHIHTACGTHTQNKQSTHAACGTLDIPELEPYSTADVGNILLSRKSGY